LDISGRVLISIENESAGGADVRAYGEALVDALATAATVLGGECWGYRFRSLTGACCLVHENAEEAPPSGVLNALVEARLLAGPVREIAAIPVAPPSGLGAGRRLKLAGWIAS
jgi:hypothetical protein